MLRRHHVLIGNEIVGDYFYPQLFATALCLIFLRIAISLTSQLRRLAFALVAVCILSYTYNLSAVVFALAFIFNIFCEMLANKMLRLNLRSGLALAGTCTLLVAALVAPASFRFMILNSAYSGGISVQFAPLTMVIIALATVVTALWVGTQPERLQLTSLSARLSWRRVRDLP